MFIRNWKTEILTIPNLLSILRLGMIPVYVELYRNAQDSGDYWIAGAVLALSCLTDAADGYIARRFHMISLLGKVLDPIADKATQIALTLCLCLRFPVLKAVLALLLVKESFQVAACIVSFRRGKMLSGAMPAGKICTAVLFISLIALVVFPEPKGWVVNTVAITDCVFLTFSFISYMLAYWGKHPRIRDVDF